MEYKRGNKTKQDKKKTQKLLKKQISSWYKEINLAHIKLKTQVGLSVQLQRVLKARVREMHWAIDQARKQLNEMAKHPKINPVPGAVRLMQTEDDDRKRATGHMWGMNVAQCRRDQIKRRVRKLKEEDGGKS